MPIPATPPQLPPVSIEASPRAALRPSAERVEPSRSVRDAAAPGLLSAPTEVTPPSERGGPLGWLKKGFQALKDGLRAAGRFVLSPYLNFAAKKGAESFLRLNAGDADSVTPQALGMRADALSFKAKDGTPLKGWHIPASPPSGKTVVLAHGHGGRMDEMLRNQATWLHEAGYDVVAFDFRNSGRSGGAKTTLGFEERWDLEAAITQAQGRGAKEIAVLGVSMGGATALAEAADDPRVKAVVADCAFDTLRNAIEPRVAQGTFDLGPFKGLHYPFNKLTSEAILERAEAVSGHPLRSTEPLAKIGGLKDRPVFLIHGAEDQDTPPQTSRNLAQADPDAALWIVPGAGHAQSYETAPREYEKRVLDFLKRSGF